MLFQSCIPDGGTQSRRTREEEDEHYAQPERGGGLPDQRYEFAYLVKCAAASDRRQHAQRHANQHG